MDGESHDARSERLESRLRILTGALREFAEATADYVRLVDVVAKTLADVVGDGCVVRMLAEDGWLSPVAVHFPIGQIQDAEKLERMKAFLAARRHMTELDSVRRLIETGEHVLMTHVDLGEIRASGSAAVLDLFETVGIHSLLVVALRIHGKSIGLLSLVRFRRHSRPFTEQDRHTAQALADHAALAIANAQLVQRLEGLLAERTAELKVLRGMLPICAWCKRIRDDDRGSWAAIETYVAQHSEATFTHGICPSCAESMQR